jgi:hypothetical protein
MRSDGSRGRGRSSAPRTAERSGARATGAVKTAGISRCWVEAFFPDGLEGAVPGYPPYNIERVSEGRYRMQSPVLLTVSSR